MKRTWGLKGLIDKVDNNTITIKVNYKILKPEQYKELAIINIEHCKNKDLLIKNNFVKIKGINKEDQKYGETVKLKYILDNSYWSAPGVSVSGGPHSTSDSTRNPSWRVVWEYYKDKLKRKNTK